MGAAQTQKHQRTGSLQEHYDEEAEPPIIEIDKLQTTYQKKNVFRRPHVYQKTANRSPSIIASQASKQRRQTIDGYKSIRKDKPPRMKSTLEKQFAKLNLNGTKNVNAFNKSFTTANKDIMTADKTSRSIA